MKKEIQKIQNKILKIDYICSGSITKLYKKCGKKECKCNRFKSAMHGPYYVWTRKVNGKTVTKTLTKEQKKLCEKFIINKKKLLNMIKELELISIEYIEQSRKEL